MYTSNIVVRLLSYGYNQSYSNFIGLRFFYRELVIVTTIKVDNLFVQPSLSHCLLKVL